MRRCANLALWRIFVMVSMTVTLVGVAALLGVVLMRGLPAMGPALLFGDVSPLAAMTGAVPVWDGIWPACAGTFALLMVALGLAVLPGIGCGIHLALFASPRTRVLLGLAVDLLAGVPSIVMGLFGFTLLLALRRTVAPDASTGLLLASVCLALLVLPVLVVTTRGALEALPAQLRLTGAALGLDTWGRLRHLLLPAAGRGILGGVLLAAGRAAEDTAVIMLTGVVASVGLPAGLGERFEALPFTIFYLSSQYRDAVELQRGFGAATVLLVLSLTLLAGAWLLQRVLERKWRGVLPVSHCQGTSEDIR